jgi:membrane protease YdiL (CAAX protease family)
MSDLPFMVKYRDITITCILIAAFLGLLPFWFFLPEGEWKSFIGAGVTVFPFVILAQLAFLGEWYRPSRYLAVLCLLAVLFMSFCFVVLYAIFPALCIGSGDHDTPHTLQLARVLIESVLAGICAGVASLAGFSRTFRGYIARYIPIDPDSFVHMIGLVTLAAITLMCAVPLIINGSPPLLDPGVMEMIIDDLGDEADMIRLETYGLIWTVAGSAFMVGLWIRQDLRGTLARLGLVRPTPKQVLIGIGAAFLLLGLFHVAEPAITHAFGLAGIPTTDEAAIEKLFGAMNLSPLVALIASISAGIGEELTFRGVLQPRFGIVLSALVFASAHAFQYSWDGIVVVLLVGICLGIIRKYTNTTTSAITHGTYDLVLFLLPFITI